VRYVHRFVPAPGNPPAPRALLLLHGTGGNEDDLLPLGPMLDPAAALVSPRGDVLENARPRFFRRLHEGVFDEADLRVRARALAEFVGEAREAYHFGPATAAGFSNGANVAGAILLLHPGVLAGAILLAPMVPITPDPLPSLAGTPVFIGAGRVDPLVSVPEAERLAALLQRAGADVTLHWHPGGHAIHPSQVAAAHAWLAARSG
jgi:phospholipase/carboxylesterase